MLFFPRYLFEFFIFTTLTIYSANAEVPKLKSTASTLEILDAMRSAQTGLGFLTQHPSLPSQTFVSADAVQWLNTHTEGGLTAKKSLKIMQSMITERLICHASGDFSKPFILGFYLYHIVQEPNQKSSDYSPPLGDLQSFENEWVEIEMKAPKNWCNPTNSNSSSSSNSTASLSTISSPIPITTCDTIDESNIPAFLRDELDLNGIDDKDYQGDYKHTHLDIDLNSKSDR